jgi:hypothetical protein
MALKSRFDSFQVRTNVSVDAGLEGLGAEGIGRGGGWVSDHVRFPDKKTEPPNL